MTTSTNTGSWLEWIESFQQQNEGGDFEGRLDILIGGVWTPCTMWGMTPIDYGFFYFSSDQSSIIVSADAIQAIRWSKDD